MERAFEATRNCDVGLNSASRKYSVLKATLKRHSDGKNYFAVENTQVIGSVEDIPSTRGTGVRQLSLTIRTMIYDACRFKLPNQIVSPEIQ